ncbi:MAG: nickel-dependent lactate racemase [Pyrinomonadaceae bacterium]|nr:nickel-dependent lactate racemase [Pyrinomonadaceae bacterium]
MNKPISLSFGKTHIPFEYEEARFEVLDQIPGSRALGDRELGELFDSPFDSANIEELIGPNETVLVVVPDGTRKVGAGQVVNLLVRRLIAAGAMPYDIGIAFATGLHRKVNRRERKEILTPFIEQRIKTIDHDPSDLLGFVRLGTTSSGIPIEINRKVLEADHVILVGGVSFHYFAGFTGGRKLVCPGLASKRTIVGTHSLAFEKMKMNRAEGVRTGKLTGNPVHESFVEVVEKVNPSFGFNTFVDQSGDITDLVCGDWKTSHEEACRRYLSAHQIGINEKRGLVIASCGGFPFDINLIQAHKAIDAASRACKEGGSIVLIAECSDGFGSTEFEKWLGRENADSIANDIAENYAVGGQTAWNLLRLSEKFDIKIVTKLRPRRPIQGVTLYEDLSGALADTIPSDSGYIIPHGAKFLPVQKENGPAAV